MATLIQQVEIAVTAITSLFVNISLQPVFNMSSKKSAQYIPKLPQGI